MIAIVYISDIFTNPFLEKYIEVIAPYKDYRIIYWNRKGKIEGVFKKGNIIEYSYNQDANLSKIKKINGFYKFRKFLFKEIKMNNYNKIIVLTTMTGLLLYSLLKRRYKNKYIFDIRDASYEFIPGFKKILLNIIKNSYFTCISSPGFKKILPNYDYTIVNNFRYQDIEMSHRKKFLLKKKKYGETLNLVYIGAVRQYDHIKKTIDIFANDKRFNLFYHGGGSNDYLKLEEYVEEMGYNNIFFTGPYVNKDKFKLLFEADILNNHYELTYNIKYANSNKYWDGIIYKIPQFGNLNSYDGNLLTTENCGVALDLNNKNLLNELYEYYFNIDENLFNKICEKKIKKLIVEDKKYLNQIRNFCTL